MGDPATRGIEPIVADWPAPAGVRAVTTTRTGGVSAPPCDTLNLGAGVPDAPENVRANRGRLRAGLNLPGPPVWLRQVHGIRVADADTLEPGETPEADAVVTRRPGTVCAILTADCLPVVFTDDRGRVVAAAHAGWRGLSAGVLEATVGAMDVAPSRVMAWLGPAIGPADYEVDAPVRDAFLKADAGAVAAFRASRPGHWYCDLYRLAARRLERAGLTRVTGGSWSTAGDPARFFSHRRDGVCGRMATMVWRERRSVSPTGESV